MKDKFSVPFSPILSLILLVSILLPSLPSTGFAQVKEEDVTVFLNESYIITFNGPFSEYALGNEEIADCVVRRNDAVLSEIVVNATGEGVTNLIFWDRAGKIHKKFNIVVKKRDPGEKLANIQKLIQDIEGVKAELVGDQVVVKGEVHAPEEMKKITRLLKTKPEVINSVTLSKTALKVLADIINDFVGVDGQVEVKPVGHTLVLFGTTYGDGSSKRIEDFANIFHNSVVNMIKEKRLEIDPGAGDAIQVYAHFMEVDLKAVEAYGASWTPFGQGFLDLGKGETVSDGLRSSASSWSLSGFFGNLLPKFDHARDRSLGRQLKVSSVSVKSGEKAQFQSGGELGIPVSGPNGTVTIEFKKYGMHLDVLPVSQGKNITLKVKVRVNIPVSLGGGNVGSSAGIIHLSNTEVETVQYCKSGDSIALSGLISAVDRKMFDANPGGEGALFKLFHSKDFQQEKTDLVIFITPQILGSAKEANLEIKQTVMDKFDEYDPLSR